MKKIYFIKDVAGKDPWFETLKNNYKSLDAIRDLLDWHREGFTIDIELNCHSEQDEEHYETTLLPPSVGGQGAAHVISVINMVVEWLHAERHFDIVLVKRQTKESEELSPLQSSLN
ncbi:MAG: hypothetical protein NUW37_13250 [Planctomycetes bacterium]|nr:hypothetical protein [Planctomycetota bacterium]